MQVTRKDCDGLSGRWKDPSPPLGRRLHHQQPHQCICVVGLECHPEVLHNDRLAGLPLWVSKIPQPQNFLCDSKISFTDTLTWSCLREIVQRIKYDYLHWKRGRFSPPILEMCSVNHVCHIKTLFFTQGKLVSATRIMPTQFGKKERFLSLNGFAPFLW